MNTPARNRGTPLAELGERGLVQLIRERFPASPSLLSVPIGDDAAVAIPARGELEVLTTDALVEGVHFSRAFSSLGDVGYRSLAVNVSDVAAMGGTPRLALLSLILPDGMTVGDVEDLLDGFAEMGREAGVSLAGGNLTRSPGPLIVDVSVLGSVRPRKVLTRSGGRAGDILYVTGEVGAAAAGLSWLRTCPSPDGLPELPGLGRCVARYRRPEPRMRIGGLLGRSRAATACMDLSDGLADAVTQLAGASGTGARIESEALPIPDAARRWFESRAAADPVAASVAAGDDYELLFSVPRRRHGRLRMVVQQARGVAITRIGELTASPSIVLLRDGVPEPLPAGFSHF